MKLTAIFKKIGQVLGSTANELESELDPSMEYCEGCQRAHKKGENCPICKSTFLIACGHCYAANENTRTNCGVCGWDLKESGSYAFTPEIRNLEKVKNEMQKMKDDRSKNSFFKI